MDTFRSNWKQILRIRLIKTWLLGLLTVSGCLQGTLIREDNNINSFSKIRPLDVDTSTAENIGQEALEKIGYKEIIKLSIKAGFVEYKTSMNIKLVSYESAVIADFTPVFSRYALAAAVTSQADSPIPGPADLAATGTEPAAESPGTADATGTEAGAQETSAGGWCKGSYPSAAESLKAHFEKHGPEVGTQTEYKIKVLQQAAEDFIALPNICVKSVDGTPEWTSGLGRTEMEALEKALEALSVDLATLNGNLDRDRLEWSDPVEF